MAGEVHSLPVIEEEEIDDEFYEKIQAPKFVDFTTPEIRRSHEDRYWFCLRVGCDRNHEEELDSEAIYKNFVLRVMAARSPNIRLRKVMNRREASANLKCPLTAPAKSSRPRISRLALISSLSKKIVDDKARTRPPVKINATPKNAKVKQLSAKAKAFTTPRNQKKSSNLDQFRTVQSKTAMNVAVPKNRVIAKTLVFHSPKKVVKIKSSVELKKTPMKSLCSAMKKLEIDSVKKKNEEASRKKIKGREVKSRVFDSLYPNRRLKEEKKLKGTSQIQEGGGATDDNGASSDMEIDEKSRNGSLERCHESLSLEEIEKQKSSEECCEKNEEKKIPQAATKRNGNRENYIVSDDDKENESVPNANDDKENVSAPDENRRLAINHDNLEKSKNEETKKTQKKPTSNGTIGSQVVKYRKLRPTNPKPFKFRTDERGILKEANLEKKPLEPLKDITAKGCKTMRKHHHLNQKNEQDSDNNNSCEDRTDHATEENKYVSIQCSVLGKSNMKVNRLYATPQRNAGPKLQKPGDMAERPKRQDEAAQNLDNKLRRKSPMTQPTLVVRPRSASAKKKVNDLAVTPCKQQLSIIDEKSSNLQPIEEIKSCNNGNSSSSRRKAYSANSSSRSRPSKKTITVPKEPNFHSLHVPKSCTKKKKKKN